MKRFILSLFLLLIPLQLGYLHLKTPLQSQGTVAGLNKTWAAGVINSASIGGPGFSLFGYTSPKSLVNLEGTGISEQTTSDSQGYFEFKTYSSPFIAIEACLSSKDQFGRMSAPVCLPPFPIDYKVSIGPVILPPTLSLNNKDYFMGDEVILSGQAVPNTLVKLSFFGDQSNKDLSLIKPVEAFTFPELVAVSDEKGNYSVDLPSSSPNKFRLFAQTQFKDWISPNSNRLTFDILPIWMMIVRFFLFLWSLLKPRLLEIFIILEILYIINEIWNHFQKKAIIPYQSHLPMKEESHLPLIKD